MTKAARPAQGLLAESSATRVVDAVRVAGPALLFGLRLWASVCLALYVTYWLELDNPYWAGTTAAIVCQPHLGASLRKGWFQDAYIASAAAPICGHDRGPQLVVMRSP